MKIRKLGKCGIIILLILVMTANKSIAADLVENKYGDIQDHWAKDTIQVWSDYKIVKGYKGEFRPNDYMTRGEVSSILDRIFKYIELSDIEFKDLNNGVHDESILKLHKKKIINGYPDNTVRSKAYVSREEMAVLINKAFEIDEDNLNREISYFTDQSDISNWAENHVLALAKNGYVKGDNKKAFNPQNYTTRAEVMTIIDNIIGDLYNTPQTYGDNKGKISIVNIPNVTLRDMILEKKLIIAEGVGDGDVTLDSIKSKGDILIKGGGENSIIIKGDSVIKNIIARREESGVHIIIEGNANVETFYIDDGSDNVNITGKVETVIIESISNNIIFKDAEVKNIIVSRGNSNISIDKNSKVDMIMVNKLAKDTEINVEGSVSKLTSEAAKTVVSGKGKVDRVDFKGEKGEDKTERDDDSGDSSSSGNSGSSGKSKDPKPPVNPDPPLEPSRPGYYSVFMNVDGEGHIRVEAVEEVKPPLDPEPPLPPIIEKPNVIIIVDGEGRVSAELVKESEPDKPLPEGDYEIRIKIEGKGYVIMERIN